MAAYIRENNFKFDKVDRTYKKDTINAIANSIYHLKDPEKISEALGYYLDIYRTDGKKSYDGSTKRFMSHYIPAIEFGVIKSSSPYLLSDLAIKMVNGDINPTEYMSTILLNYFQIIGGKCVNLLYQVLLLIEKIGNVLVIGDLIEKEYFQEREHTIIAMKILGDSYFFKYDRDKLIFNELDFNLKKLLKITRIKEEEANKYVIESFKSQENFSNFLCNYEDKSIVFPTLKKEIIKNLDKTLSYQKIVYGAPGTGKSYNLQKEVEKNFEKDSLKRVTFYDGYTYGQFIGAYKPVMYEKDNGEKEIGYKFVVGPLLEQILNAYKYPEKDFILIIEEINRAKVDRVFGDVFQLLDRNSEGDSEYPISLTQEQDNYFKENLDSERYLDTISKKEGLFLPNNLYIWATMNSADQGVYPMDTAFKRRWDFEYISLNKNRREEELFIKIYKKIYSWNDYRETLNDVLGEQGITEDRLISPYFLKETDFDENKILKNSSYVNKFLMYVFDDILKHNNRLKEALFIEKNFYKIFEQIEDKQIYSIDFLNRLNEKITEE
ncbi:AAA family ATPase [Cetobacterium sp.]|uniref:AAA family ATPase n=1 Tax=Cetobacterium sp. TaxID=2071632 RepID=UPI003F38550F